MTKIAETILTTDYLTFEDFKNQQYPAEFVISKAWLNTQEIFVILDLLVNCDLFLIFYKYFGIWRRMRFAMDELFMVLRKSYNCECDCYLSTLAWSWFSDFHWSLSFP